MAAASTSRAVLSVANRATRVLAKKIITGCKQDTDQCDRERCNASQCAPMTAATDRLGERMGSKYPPGPVQNLFFEWCPQPYKF